MKTRIEASQRRVVNILHNHLNVMNLIWLTLTALLATKFEIGQNAQDVVTPYQHMELCPYKF